MPELRDLGGKKISRPTLTSAEPTPPFELDFNLYVAGDYNRDFGGKGTLTIRADEPRFVFRARPRRGLFLGKEPADLALRSDQISNVSLFDRGLAFITPAGKSGEKRKPFVFTCRSPADAAAIAAQLPATQDEEFRAGEDFTARLRQLPDARSGLQSVTNILILTNVAAFIAMGFAGAGWIEVASMEPYLRFGANNGAATTDGQWWRLLTCMFLHYGILHLLLNQWALLQAGLLVERLLGRALFTLTYFGSGLLGSLTTLHWNGDKSWSAGASGAVFGVYGALLGYIVREKHTVPRSVFQPLLKSTLVFAGYNLFYGAVHPNIDNAAHVGGFLAGGLLGWLAARPIELAARRRLFIARLRVTALVTLVLIGLGIATAPHFDYRVTDERAWAETNHDFGAREEALLARRGELFTAYQNTRNADALLAWLDEVARLYQSWRAAVLQLPLGPGFSTTKLRDEFAPILAQKAAAHAHLAEGLRAHAPNAISRFNDEERAANAAIQAYTERRDASIGDRR